MDSRHAHTTQRPPPPQRTVSSNHRPPLPSRLSNVRSASQPFVNANVSGNGARSADGRNAASFMSNRNVVYTEPEVIDLEAENNERPAKRLKTGGQSFRAGDDAGDIGKDTARQIVPGTPLPPLRKQNASAGRNTAHKSRPAVNRLARKANGLEPPAMATRLPAPRNVADFSPWNGHHPEDQLSETVVKAGYFDKPPGPNSTESNSAKPTIWPNLSQKNNMGLQTLSYLFTSVMEKRQAMGRCTAPSTFKPPPRVTVTDTKREAWLRDLANPDVPLRKQSRTIPHGIRGKLLMEQCLGKDIPMPRAVWLAKCVGANELRAFRRKGVSGAAAASGEQKWVREWTIAVEQFLEGVITTCGQPEWQSKMDYAVKLATSFYSERLLDRDHYLEWVVSSFTQNTVERLPIWIILVQLYWKDITAFGRRGRLLAEAILENLHKSNLGTMRTNEALKDHLRKLIMVMAVTSRGCLILPRTWEKYRYILAPRSLPSVYASVESPAHNIAKRNARLAGPLHKTPQNTRCALLDLYSVLDRVGLHLNIEELASICSGKVQSAHRLVVALLDWSASVFRAGRSRIYLASRLISQLAKQGHDVDGAVLDYLKNADAAQLHVQNVHHTIGELVRLKSFSPGRYMQWLMVSGALYTSEPSEIVTGLLKVLPTNALPTHLLSTKRMLMQRLGHLTLDAREVDQAEADFVNLISPQPGNEQESEQTTYSSASPIAIDGMADSEKLDFAQRIATRAKILSQEGDISLRCFDLMRENLENAGDITTLADVIESASYTQSSLLLASIGDTVNMHAHTLAAIGRLQGLAELLLDRYKVLRSQTLDRTCILSMASLVKRLPQMISEARLFDTDLAICESQGMMAVCSPASDSLVNMQASNLDSDDDIDRVFDSGNTMDEQLMQRLFSRIVQRAHKVSRSGAQVPSKVCEWFNKLRAIDMPGFDELAKNYVQASLKCISADDVKMSCTVISALIASQCMSFPPIVRMAKENKTSSAASVAIRLLTSDESIADSLHRSERYRFQVQRACYQSDYAGDVFQLLATAMEDAKTDLGEDTLIDFVRKYANVDTSYLGQLVSAKSLSSTAAQNCRRLMAGLLDLKDANGGFDANSLVALADPLSIVHRGAALSFCSASTGASNDGVQSAVESAVVQAIKSGSEVWPQLLEAAGQSTIKSIYQWARDHVVNRLLQQDDATTVEPEQINRHLDILDVAFHATKEDDSTAVLPAVNERLKGLEQRLSSPDFDDTRDGKQIACCTHVLLHLSTLYGTSSSPADTQTRITLLTTLCALLSHPRLQNKPSILEYIHDVASIISDTIPAELLCTLKTQPHDPRLAFILGSTPNPDSWLALVTNPQPPQQSQQQRALMKQQAGRQSPLAAQQGAMKGAGSVRVQYPLRRWEVMPDATPTIGENDTSLSLGLFGARRV